MLAFIKSAPGNVSLESMMTEMRKLAAVRAIELPPGLFTDVAPKVLASWRAGRRWLMPVGGKPWPGWRRPTNRRRHAASSI
ncbi:hypothetical protein ACIBQ1_56500 [Nonomuraea sp. NPDC050153]|uniref:hypothetical protein n=1 Tax=Nonomuraea sp. NPDC050153 TaxID=3364359 RepID=UPI00379AAECD